MMPMEPKEIAEQADAIAKNQGASELAHLAELVAELARGLDVFFATLKQLGESK